MSKIDVLANLNMMSSEIILEHHYGAFPTEPKPGEICVVDGVLFCYVTLDSGYFWVPITNKSSMYSHTQTEVSSTWSVEHNLGTYDYIYAIYDSNNMIQLASVINISMDQVSVNLTSPMSGRAVFIGAKSKSSLTDCSLTTVLEESVTSGVVVPEVPTSELFFQVEV